MNTLNFAEMRKFLERFYRCNDGVIRRVQVSFRSAVNAAKATIIISVRDRETAVNEEWINLYLELRGLSEFACCESTQASYQILSDGLYIGCFGDMLFLDFGGGIAEPESEEEFRQSKFYFVGQSLIWEVLPYSE